MPAASYSSGRIGGTVLNSTCRADEPLEPQRQVVEHEPAQVAAGRHAPFVAEHVRHERVHVACVRRDVVVVVVGEPRVAEPREVRHDHLEPRRDQRLDVPPPDPLRLRPPVQQQQREAARALAHVRHLDPVAYARVLNLEVHRPNVTCARGFVRPENDRAQVAAGMGRRAHLARLERRARRGRAHVVRPRDAPVPLGRAAHRPPEELLDRRRDRALPPPQRRAGCCTRWATTPSACPPRTTRSRPASTRATRPRPSIAEFRRQFKEWGISIDWDREFGTHEPRYYRWTQWIFLRLFEKGLAYRKEAAVNWCPQDATVLANEQVLSDGTCERCGTQVEVRQLEQWFFRITDYADRLLDDLETIDWPQKVVTQQEHWIGRSEGAEVVFRCEELGHRLPGLHDAARHAVRRDVLRHGARAPRRPQAERLAGGARLHRARGPRVGRGARSGGQGEDGRPARAHRHQPRERRADPDVRRRLRADGVRHRRDHGRARARRARLRVRAEVRARDQARRSSAATCRARTTARLVNSGQFDGMHNREAFREIVDWLEAEGKGKPAINYQPARLAPLAPALLGLPDPRRPLRLVRHRRRCRTTSSRSSCRTSRTTRPRASRRSLRPRSG